MACYLKLKPWQTPATRRVEVKASTARLKAQIAAGKVKVKIGANGGIVFVGWDAADRDGVADVCAFRALQAEGSPELRRAIAAAEVVAGRKIDQTVINSGAHSHDGGKTWDKGH